MLKKIVLIILVLIVLMFVGSNFQNRLTQPTHTESRLVPSGDVTAEIEDVSVLDIDRGENQTRISFEIKLYVNNTYNSDFKLDLFEGDFRVTFPNKTVTEVISGGGSNEGSQNASERVGMDIQLEAGFIRVTPLEAESKISRNLNVTLEANSPTRFSIVEDLVFEQAINYGDVGEIRLSGHLDGNFPLAFMDSYLSRFTILE